MNHRHLLIPAVVAALLGVSVSATAGDTLTVPVNVTSSSGYLYARGSIADARADADPDTYIGCLVYGSGSSTIASCYAEEPASAGGQSAFCYPSGAALENIRNMNDDSYVYFQVPADGSDCQLLLFSNDSRYAPKQP